MTAMGLLLFSMLMFFTMIFATASAMRGEAAKTSKPAQRFILTK
jgi:hypothetical protein